MKKAPVWNRTRDLLYYTQHVYNPSNNYACGKLVDCLTYSTTNELLFDTYIGKQLTAPSVVAFYYELAT